MNIEQIIFLKRYIFKNSPAAGNISKPEESFIMYASQTDSAGGKRSDKADQQEINAPQASDNKRAKDNTGQAESEDITNKASDQKDNASITEPDTNLTGDTGNLDIGQTDLGASGTGAEDI